jgi:hypothetical protein
VVVWATVLGSTTGSVVSGAASDAGEAIGLPTKGGSYLLSGLMVLLIVARFPIEQRIRVQGVGDLAMIGSGAAAGVSAGVLYSMFGYNGVNVGNAMFGTLLVGATLWTFLVVRRQPVVPTAT